MHIPALLAPPADRTSDSGTPGPARQTPGSANLAKRANGPCEAAWPFGHSPVALPAILEVPIVLDVALADDFPAAVNQVELAELFVIVLQVDCPIPASGSSGIGTPG